MQQLNQADYYRRRSDEQILFSARATSADGVRFHTDLANRYAQMATEAWHFGRAYSQDR